MESTSSNEINSINFHSDLMKRRLLTLTNSHIYLTNVSLDIFTSNNNVFQEPLSYIVHMVKTIIEKTESTIVLNIYLKEPLEKKAEEIQYKQIERVLLLFYSQAILTKFIENKYFYISFPQLVGGSNDLAKMLFDLNSNYSLLDNVFLFDLFKGDQEYEKNKASLVSELSSEYIKVENLNMKRFYYFGGEEMKEYSKTVNESLRTNELKLLQQEISKIEECVANTKDDLLLFSLDNVALGGSFDHFHLGHNMLLATAAFLSKQQIFIGVTSNEMISKKGSDLILQPYGIREGSVRRALEKMGTRSKVATHTLHDVAGNAGSVSHLDALIITEETLKGGLLVNQKRVENKLPEVTLIKAHLINDCASGLLNKQELNKVSSTSIRNRMLERIAVNKLESLLWHWNKLTLKVLKCPIEMSKNWFSIIRDFYMQSWRAYHTLNHIYYYVITADQYYQDGKIKDYANILLSVWFHDIIYTPARPDNEDRSVEKFIEFFEEIKRALVLEGTIELINSEKIIKYIMATKYHFTDDTYDDPDLNYFLDFDLYSMGSDKHLDISEGIKYEFLHHLTEDEFKEGRKKFLTFVLNKKFIFRTDEIKSKLEEAAKRNIQKEFDLYNK